MGIIDFILNLAGLLLWLNWRSIRFDPLGKRTPATLIGTLRRAEPQRLRRWHLLAALGGLLLLRAVFYWQIGPGVGWAAGKLDLGATTLFFRSDSFGRILLFSISSFGLTLAIFYLWLLLLSILDGPEPFHRLVRMQLGPIDRWSRGIKLILPFGLTVCLWWLASWPLTWLAIMPQPVSAAHRVEESLVIGLGCYLAWKYVAVALLVLHLLNSYIYFGRHPFWRYITAEAQTLLRPLRAVPLQVGKADFTPIVGMVLVFLLAEFGERGLAALYLRLPF
ncbi:MAG TPA: hypothetical protein VMA13_07070 [Candidatus Saccharimonadales bacterium]|nr:hypothetical protein [Candidatus Saccharimonadales bacterium]